MRRDWVLGCTLYVVFFVLTIVLRWGQLDQPYTDFTWNTAHSQLIVDNWLEHGFWNERGISFLHPPSIEFPSLLSRGPYISFPCGAQALPFVLAKALGGNVTPGFFHAWGLAWHGAIGGIVIWGLVLFSAGEQEPERTLYAFLPGFIWLGTRGPLTFFPTLWFADPAVLLPFVLVGLAEVIVAHGVLRERSRRWITWSLPGLIFWGMYTDWLFVPLCAVILGYRMWHQRQVRAILPAFVWQIAVPAAVAITLFLLQVFWVLGPHVVSALLEKFLIRSMDTAGTFARHEFLLWYVYGHFVQAMGGLTIVLTVLALLLLCARPAMLSRPSRDFLVLVSAPSLVLLLIFRQHAAVHPFTIVKFMIPSSILLGSVLPRAFVFPYKPYVLVLLCFFLLLYEGRQYWSAGEAPVDWQALAWEDVVRGRFGYNDVLFTPMPDFEISVSPPGPLARSRKRIYAFDAERIAQLRMTLPAVRIVLLGTAEALESYCTEKRLLRARLWYCRP